MENSLYGSSHCFKVNSLLQVLYTSNIKKNIMSLIYPWWHSYIFQTAVGGYRQYIRICSGVLLILFLTLSYLWLSFSNILFQCFFILVFFNFGLFLIHGLIFLNVKNEKTISLHRLAACFEVMFRLLLKLLSQQPQISIQKGKG